MQLDMQEIIKSERCWTFESYLIFEGFNTHISWTEVKIKIKKFQKYGGQIWFKSYQAFYFEIAVV